ncbi:MAG TPA: hypothetical protein VFN10_02760 [Thermoanaerobaculia bacterium]|nr:hypothetical protein [Thermoanaerobaculia bacterium]
MTSPATQLRDVVVTNEQTRATWRARSGSIRDGCIVIPRSKSATEGEPRQTFTITAKDGAQRTRSFTGVVIAQMSGKEIVFR